MLIYIPRRMVHGAERLTNNYQESIDIAQYRSFGSAHIHLLHVFQNVSVQNPDMSSLTILSSSIDNL